MIKESKTSFQTELLRQSMTTAASALTSNALKAGLHSYREEIQEDIRQQIHATLMEHESELMRLIKHDEWTGRSKAREILIGKGNAILADHRENWRQVHQKILRGVAGNIPLFSAGLTGFEMVETVNEVKSLTKEFCSEFGEKIKEVAHSSTYSDEGLLRARLSKKGEGIGVWDAPQVIQMMEEKSTLQGERFTAANDNAKLSEQIDLSKYDTGRKERIDKAYSEVRNMESAANKGVHKQELAKIEEETTVAVTNKVMQVIKTGLIAPLSGVIGSYSGSYFAGYVQKYMAEHQAQYVAANDENMNKLIDEIDKQSTEVNAKQHLKDIEKTLSEIEKAKNDDLTNRPDMKFAIKAVALLLVSKEGFKHEDAVKLAYNEVRNVEQNMGPRVQKANVLVLKEYGLAGIALLAITVKAIEDKYDIDLGNKGSIFSTPIHKDEDQNLETPAHEEGAKTESFPGEENTLNQQPGLEHPGIGFKLPGFDAKEVDDLNILFKDNDEAFVKLFGKKMADNLIKKINDDNYLKQHEKFKKQDGSNRYECEKQQSPLWKELESYKEPLKTNNADKGKEVRYYRWDEFHKDIEVYDSKGREMGSIDPVSGKNYRPGSGIVNQGVRRIIK